MAFPYCTAKTDCAPDGRGFVNIGHDELNTGTVQTHCHSACQIPRPFDDCQHASFPSVVHVTDAHSEGGVSHALGRQGLPLPPMLCPSRLGNERNDPCITGQQRRNRACKSKLGVEIAVTNLSGPLMRFVKEKKLLRAKNSDDRFVYWAK